MRKPFTFPPPAKPLNSPRSGAVTNLSSWIPAEIGLRSKPSFASPNAMTMTMMKNRRAKPSPDGFPAMRLYYRVYDLFPNSPLAAEGLYRAADIRWQIERSDVLTRPSAREREAYMRGQIDEEWMKLVIKKFPGTKWADLAAFHMLENKLCGDWQGASKCPEKESELYEKYVKEHPQSPSNPEALYDAAWRQSEIG